MIQCYPSKRLPYHVAVTNTSVHPSAIFDESDALAAELLAVVDLPLFDESPRIRTSDVACSLSLEHWASARVLLRSGLLPSAVVVHRAQFEALARSIWLLYAASDHHLSKLTATLSLDSEQAAKNMPQTVEMMQDLESKAPPQAYNALSRFKDNSWKALNSYAHAGIHPIRRHSDGYPVQLLHDILRNANGLAVVSCMQAAVLSAIDAEVLSAGFRRPTVRWSFLLLGQHDPCLCSVDLKELPSWIRDLLWQWLTREQWCLKRHSSCRCLPGLFYRTWI
jgi:hypothetical protein